MPIGTPVQLATFVANNISGNSITTTVDAPAGSLIIVFVSAWAGTNGTATTVIDSASNTYTLAVQNVATVGQPYPGAIFYCLNSANDLPIGGTVTVSNSGSINQNVGIWKVSGANGGLDAINKTFSSGTSLSISTGTLTSSSEIVFGGVGTAGSMTGYTIGSGFTELFFGFTGSMSAAGFGYQIVSSTTSVTWAPSWTGGGNKFGVLASFKATAGSSFQPAWTINRNSIETGWAS